MTITKRTAATAIALAAVAPLAFAGAAQADGAARRTMYTISNAPTGNAVVAYSRMADGPLVPAATYATTGMGTGAGLGSQGAIVLSPNGDRLVAVNAGSDSITAFAVERGGSLRYLDTVASGGDMPISVTVRGRLVYVLNAASNTISGFRFDQGELVAIPGAVKALGGLAGGQVSFTPEGDQLVVTGKGSSTIDVFAVAADGSVSDAVTSPSTGMTPFGFSFDEDGHLVVSNAAGGAALASSVSTYRVADDGVLEPLDGPVATNQTAACWVAITPGGRFAFTTNTGSGNVSALALREDGRAKLLGNGNAAQTGAGPIDAVVKAKDLYVINGAGDTISVHSIGNDGSLTSETTLVGVPATAVGLAVG